MSNVSLPHSHTSLVLEKYDKIIMLKIPHFSHFTFSSIEDSTFKLDKKIAHSLFSTVNTEFVLYSHWKSWIDGYQAISPMGNTGICSYKAVVTTFVSTSQYIPCFMYVSVAATVLNIQHWFINIHPTANSISMYAFKKQICSAHFPVCKEYHWPLVLSHTKSHISTGSVTTRTQSMVPSEQEDEIICF